MLRRKKPLTRKTPLRAKPKPHADGERDGGDLRIEAERKVWLLLENRGAAGLRFRRNERVGTYRCDFLCPAARLAILLNSENGDDERAAALHSQGYRVLAFAAAEACRDPQIVHDAIADAFTLRVIASSR